MNLFVEVLDFIWQVFVGFASFSANHSDNSCTSIVKACDYFYSRLLATPPSPDRLSGFLMDQAKENYIKNVKTT